MLKKLFVFLLLTIALTSCERVESTHANNAQTLLASAEDAIDNSTLEQAFANKHSDVWVHGAGVVVKLLADDTKGAQHQKFLVRINPQQTLLFAHNIDLAPRVPLALDDQVRFQGEYVYNPKGGVVHWTHHDPKGRHAGGWIVHQGQTYQ